MPTPYFPKSPIKLDYIYFHVGRFVTFYADAEEGIEACNFVFMKALLIPLVQRPRNTQRRIAMFRECLAEVRITPEQRQTGQNLIDQFAVMADHRQWIVHASTWDNSFQTRNPIVSYIKRSLATGEQEFRDYHLADIEELADDCLKLYSGIWEWLTEDLGLATPEDVDKSRSKLGM